MPTEPTKGGVTIGRWIGRRIPTPIGRHLILPLCRRFAPTIYADAMKKAEAEHRNERTDGRSNT